MILLAVDTSHTRGSLAIAQLKDNVWTQLAYRSWQKKAMHSEVATVEVQSALLDAGLNLRQISHLAVNVGPGSFTGLRVGLNLVRTLAYSLDLPVAIFNSLELVAWREASVSECILVANKAVQNFYYVAAYAKENSSELVTRLEPQSVEDSRLSELKSSLHASKIQVESPTDARDIVLFLDQSAVQRRFFSWQDVKPLYIRGSEAEEKLKRGLLRQ